MRNLIFLLITTTALLGCKGGGGGSAGGGSTDPGDTTICQDPTATNYGMVGECEYGSGGGPETFSGWFTYDFLLGQPNLGDSNLTEADPETIYSSAGDWAYGTTDFGWGDYFTGVKDPQCGKVGGFGFIGIQEGYNNTDPLLIGVYVNSTTDQIEITPLGLNITCNMGSCNSSQVNGTKDTLQADCDGGIMEVDVNTRLAHNENFGVLTYGVSVYTLISLDRIESNFPDTYGTYTGYLIDGGSGINTNMLSTAGPWVYDFGYGMAGATYDSPDRFSVNFSADSKSGTVFLGTDQFNVHSAKVFITDMDDGSGGDTLGVLSILGDHIVNPGGGDYVFRGGGAHLIFYSTLD